MDNVSQAHQNRDEISRRRLLRKAAYTAPAVFAITAAPHVALGKSGSKSEGGITTRPDNKPIRRTSNSSSGSTARSTSGNANHNPDDDRYPVTNTGVQGTVGGTTSTSGGTGELSVIAHAAPPPIAASVDPAIGSGGAAPVITALPNTGSGQLAKSIQSSASKIATASMIAAAATGTIAVAMRKSNGETVDAK